MSDDGVLPSRRHAILPALTIPFHRSEVRNPIQETNSMSKKLYSVLAAIAVVALCVVAISSFANAGTVRASSEPFLTEAGVALSETEANEPDRYVIQLTD